MKKSASKKSKRVSRVKLSDTHNEFKREIKCNEKHANECSLKNIVQNEHADYVFSNKGCTYYKKGDRMGKSSRYGTVYYTCCNQKKSNPKECNHITKIVDFGKSSSPDMFHQEIMLQQLAAKHKIAPSIEKAYITRRRGIMVMKRMDQTLLDYIVDFMNTGPTLSQIKRKATKLANMFCDLVFKLHKLNITHGDLHVNNIMFKKNKMYLIDFGKAHMRRMTRQKFNYEYRFLDDYAQWKYLARSIHDIKNGKKIVDSNIKTFYDSYFDTITERKKEETKKLNM